MSRGIRGIHAKAPGAAKFFDQLIQGSNQFITEMIEAQMDAELIGAVKLVRRSAAKGRHGARPLSGQPAYRRLFDARP
ncbi:hypothetical protein DFAR_1410004 [Desulfarculales bacterium]